MTNNSISYKLTATPSLFPGDYSIESSLTPFWATCEGFYTALLEEAHSSLVTVTRDILGMHILLDDNLLLELLASEDAFSGTGILFPEVASKTRPILLHSFLGTFFSTELITPAHEEVD